MYGSNLGPVLFLLYLGLNDLPNAITKNEVWLFADDVGHTVGGKNIESIDSEEHRFINIDER